MTRVNVILYIIQYNTVYIVFYSIYYLRVRARRAHEMCANICTTNGDIKFGKCQVVNVIIYVNIILGELGG